MERIFVVGLVVVVALLIMPISVSADPSPNAFQPGVKWLDTDGKTINCHGGGFLFQDGTYYWFGEHRAGKLPDHTGVACYSSTDLYHWTNRGVVLATSADGDDLLDGCAMERPKVIFNSKTRKFVMWFHLELKGQGYKAARAAVAVSDTPTGQYTYLGSFRNNAGIWPIGFPEDLKAPITLPNGPQWNDSDPDRYLRRDFVGGQMSRDQTLFVDDDGSAYQITSSEENATMQINKLTEDYLKPSGQYCRLLVGNYNEAPAMFKHNGRYYLITSGTTGWKPNAGRITIADNIMGPWKLLGNPFVGPPEQTNLSFNSQAASVLKVEGKTDAFIYVGDRWQPRDLANSPILFLPISFTGDGISIAWKDRWDLSVFDAPATKQK
jgi:beta-xylosidase